MEDAMKTFEVIMWVFASAVFFASNLLSAWNYFKGVR